MMKPLSTMEDSSVDKDTASPAVKSKPIVVETNTSIATNLAKYEILVSKSQTELDNLTEAIQNAEDLVKRVGLSARSGLQDIVDQFRDGSATVSSTGGHSNTDHLIITTGDYVTDRIAELRRTLLNRCREAVPETRGDDRWDKQKAPGERRRRIVRSKDSPEAPPEPPPSAYIIYLAQMTTKMRHDRPNEPHRQPLVMRQVSKLWTTVLSEDERKYYADFCSQVQEEYKFQNLEYRATGSFTPSELFERPDGANMWVHKRPELKNDLEREIATYDTVVFPMRPPEMDAAYKKREKEGRERRRLKLKLEAAERRRRKNLPPIVPRKRQKKGETSPEEDKADPPADGDSGDPATENTAQEQDMLVDDFLAGLQMMEADTATATDTAVPETNTPHGDDEDDPSKSTAPNDSGPEETEESSNINALDIVEI